VTEPGLVIYRFAVGLFYANAQHFADEVRGLVAGDDPPRWLVLDLGAIDDIDYTGGQTLLEEITDAQKLGVVVALAEPSARLQVELDRYGITDKVGRDRIYATVEDARDAFQAQGS